jgi:hypothetical protein
MTFYRWRCPNLPIGLKGRHVRKQLQRDESVHSAMVLVIAEYERLQVEGD